MANTAVKASSSPNHLSYLLTGDGSAVADLTIPNATLLENMSAHQGPLYEAWNTAWVTQAAMRTALLGGGARCCASVHLLVAVNDVTAKHNQISIDVDTDAVTVTKAELNIQMSEGAAGQIAMLTLSHWHSIVA